MFLSMKEEASSRKVLVLLFFTMERFLETVRIHSDCTSLFKDRDEYLFDPINQYMSFYGKISI